MKHKYNNVLCNNYIVTKKCKRQLAEFQSNIKTDFPNRSHWYLKTQTSKSCPGHPGRLCKCVCLCFTTCYFTDECYRHHILGYLPRHLTTPTTVLCLPYYWVPWISSRPLLQHSKKKNITWNASTKMWTFLTTNVETLILSTPHTHKHIVRLCRAL